MARRGYRSEQIIKKLRVAEVLLGQGSTVGESANKRIERIWGKEYNQVRPHSALNYRPPAPEVIIQLTLT